MKQQEVVGVAVNGMVYYTKISTDDFRQVGLEAVQEALASHVEACTAELAELASCRKVAHAALARWPVAYAAFEAEYIQTCDELSTELHKSTAKVIWHDTDTSGNKCSQMHSEGVIVGYSKACYGPLCWQGVKCVELTLAKWRVSRRKQA